MAKLSILILVPIVAVPALIASSASVRSHTEPSQSRSIPPFHNALPKGTLPATLAPSEFPDNRIAEVVYTLAAQIKGVLYQVPCYCGCDRRDHHDSLLACYTTRHGEWCSICQKEVIFCFREHNRGRKPEEIREALERGEAKQVDLVEATRQFGLPADPETK